MTTPTNTTNSATINQNMLRRILNQVDAPTRVVLVQPKITVEDWIVRIAGMPLIAWLLMVLLPVATGGLFTPGYWQTLALFVCANVLLKSRVLFQRRDVR